MYGVTAATPIWRLTSCSIAGWSYLTTSFSGRSIDTTIIAAVGFGRRPVLAAPASQAERTRVWGRSHQRDDDVRSDAVQRLLAAFEQNRNELAWAELCVRELLRPP